MDAEKGIKAAEVSIHSSRNDCWVVVNGQVWDVTSFMKTHPGGEDGMAARNNRMPCAANKN
jgi:cytochrome b involved in lipid metabolism